mgnify:CR=1 FL=1
MFENSFGNMSKWLLYMLFHAHVIFVYNIKQLETRVTLIFVDVFQFVAWQSWSKMSYNSENVFLLMLYLWIVLNNYCNLSYQNNNNASTNCARYSVVYFHFVSQMLYVSGFGFRDLVQINKLFIRIYYDIRKKCKTDHIIP